MRTLLRLVVKEFLQLRRDRRMIPMIFVAPLVQIVAFGYAVNTDVDRVPTVLVDSDRSDASRRLVDHFLASGYFELVGIESDVDDVEPWLVAGRAQIALVIARGYGRALTGGGIPEIQALVDGTDSTSAVVGLGYASRIVASEGLELARARLRQAVLASAAAATPPPIPGRIEPKPRVWYNPDLKSRWFYVPAVLAMVLMIMTMVLSSMGVVREKEIGTMEQLIVTPLRPWQLIVGKLTPFAVIGLVDIFLVTGVAVFWFGVPLRGSLATLVGLTMLFLLNTLGLGLLISTLARNQQQAMMTAAFLFMLPMIYLSGLIFPIENMPDAIQAVTWAVPLRYYAVIIRGVFLKGSGLAALWPQALTLAGSGLAILAVASLRFRKRLD